MKVVKGPNKNGRTVKKVTTKDGKSKVVKLNRQQRKKIERDEARKHRKPRRHFSFQGVRLFYPKLRFKGVQGLHFKDFDLNIVADVEIGNVTLDEATVKEIADRGDFLLILREYGKKQGDVQAVIVEKKAILKARMQRFHLAHTGGENTIMTMFQREIPELLDKRLKDPKKIIEKHSDDFLSAYNEELILRDIDRILLTQD